MPPDTLSATPAAERDAGDELFPVDLLPVGALICSSRVILRCNRVFADLFGYRRAELMGHSVEMLYPSHREFVDVGERWMEALRAQRQWSDTRIMRRKDGALFWFRARGCCRDQRQPFSLAGYTFEALRPAASATITLSPREREIVAAIREGRTSKEIARELKLSPRTVETYRSRLMEKLQARNSNDLLAKLLES